MTALAYCTVVGKFADLTPDGADGDTHPDAAPLTGQVTLTCDARDISTGSTSRLLLPTETPPRTITIEPFAIALDGTGAFSVEVPASGQTGVTVPSVFTYTASFNLKNAAGAKVKIPPFSFSAPIAGVDLANVAPAATSNGVNYIVGPQGPAGPTGPTGPSGGGGGILAPQALQTASFAAAIDKFWPIDTTSGTTVVATLPTAPADGKQVELKVDAGPTVNGALTHPVTVNLGGSDVLNVAGGSTSFQLTALRQSVLLQYQATGAIWHVMTGDLSLAQLQGMFAPITGIPESAVTNLTTDLAAKATKAQAIGYALVFGGM